MKHILTAIALLLCSLVYGQSVIPLDQPVSSVKDGYVITLDDGMVQGVGGQSLLKFRVEGDGTSWEYPGVSVFMTESSSGVSYILQKKSGTKYINKDTITGTGAAVYFNNQDSTGIYKVLAVCGNVRTRMLDSAVVTIHYFSTEAKAIYARMNTVPGGPLKLAISQWIDTVKYYHAYDSLDFTYCFAMQDSTSAKLDWMKSTRTATTVNHSAFVPYYGFTTDGIRSYIKTNYNPYVDKIHYKLNSSMIGCYINTNSYADCYLMGIYQGQLTVMRITSNTYYVYINNSASMYQFGAGSNVSGLTIAQRINSTTMSKARNATAFTNSGTLVSNSIPNQANGIYVGCFNSTGTPTSFTNNQFSWVHGGSQLSELQKNKLYQADNKLLTDVSAIH